VNSQWRLPLQFFPFLPSTSVALSTPAQGPAAASALFFPWSSRRSQLPRCLVSLPSHYAVMLPLPQPFFRSRAPFMASALSCSAAPSYAAVEHLPAFSPPWLVTRFAPCLRVAAQCPMVLARCSTKCATSHVLQQLCPLPCVVVELRYCSSPMEKKQQPHAVSPARVFIKSSRVVDPCSHDVSASRFAGFAQRLCIVKILGEPLARIPLFLDLKCLRKMFEPLSDVNRS
jgi:hypothetical protein